jgi:hypothetical protein
MLKENWKIAWSNRTFKNKLALSIFALAIAVHQNINFLNRWELRKGLRLNDWLLNQLVPTDFSVPIFTLTYGALTVVIISLLWNPERLVMGFQVFALMTFFRSICIYFFPLEPPAEMIYLRDPITEFFMAKEFPITKDLFFSGHTASLTVLFLMSEKNWAKWVSGLALLVVPLMLLWQHVHYTADVAFAPLASYICYKTILYFHSEKSFLRHFHFKS